jgi:integrase
MSQYLFQRGSVWYVKTQGEKRIERSLHTSDKAQAKVLAAPFIHAHERELAGRAPRAETIWTPSYEPRLTPYAGDNGEQIVAGPRELAIYDAAGALLRTEPNGGPMVRIVAADNRAIPAAIEFAMFDGVAPRGVVLKSDDDKILDAYLEHRKVTGYPRKEAEATWAQFRALTNGKPFARCTWDDGRALVAYYQSEAGGGLKVASVHKRLTRLNGAVNFAIKTGKLPRDTINPFAGVVAKEGDDSQERVPLDAADIAACQNAIDPEDGKTFWSKLRPADQLLFRVLCTTGMRLSEAFQIKSEETLQDIRFCEVVSRKGKVGSKPTVRRVPFPVHLIPYLQDPITGPLFAGTSHDAGKRLNAFLRSCGIEKDAKGNPKSLHSLRHRAISLLEENECPDHINRRLFGHATDEHEGYVKVIKVLKKWIDLIDGI